MLNRRQKESEQNTGRRFTKGRGKETQRTRPGPRVPCPPPPQSPLSSARKVIDQMVNPALSGAPLPIDITPRLQHILFHSLSFLPLPQTQRIQVINSAILDIGIPSNSFKLSRWLSPLMIATAFPFTAQARKISSAASELTP